MAEERRGHQRRDRSELYHAGYNDRGHRIEVHRCGFKLGRECDQRPRNTYRQSGTGSTNGDDTARERDRDGRTDGDLLGRGQRHIALHLSMAEEWRGHQRRDGGKLYHACDNNGG